MFSVIAALNSSAIVRLQKTWALLQTKSKDTLEYCQNQISHNKNYQKYRHILKTCEKPCIPFFGKYKYKYNFFFSKYTFLNQYDIINLIHQY